MSNANEDAALTNADGAKAWATMASDLFAGPGEMRSRCRAFDWASTPLGPVDGWTSALRSAIRMCLDSGFPTVICASPELLLVYNDAYRATLASGKHPGALGRPVREVWVEAWEQIAPEFAEVLGGGATVVRENQRFVLERGGHPEEAYFTYAFSPVRDETGAVIAVHNIAVETTSQILAERHRKAAHDALAAERARLADIIRMAPAFMAVLRGPEHVIELSNAQYDALAGHRDIRGRRVVDALPEAAGQGFVTLLDGVLTTGEPFIGREMPYHRPDRGGADDVRYLDFVYQAIKEADGVRSGVFVHGVDITDQVRARREVERLLAESEAARTEAHAARVEAETANRSKGEFLAVMSHELRTPLNAIGGYAELIEMGIHGPVTPQQRTALERIQRSQRALLSVINEVLNYARLETGAVTYDLTDVPMIEVVVASEALVVPQLRAKGLRYTSAGCDPTLEVRADRDKLQQILLNLLSNAIKFTDGQPGHAGLEVSCTVDPLAADRVVLRVRDTGVGIPSDKLAEIFEPFVQVDQGLTRTQQGTGLGLAISRDLARGMGGDLTVESALNVGSTFTLTLSRVAGNPTRAPATIPDSLVC
jgi:signal transduction histidine kinase